jgi:hypothetical protein
MQREDPAFIDECWQCLSVVVKLVSSLFFLLCDVEYLFEIPHLWEAMNKGRMEMANRMKKSWHLLRSKG